MENPGGPVKLKEDWILSVNFYYNAIEVKRALLPDKDSLRKFMVQLIESANNLGWDFTIYDIY